MKYIFIFSLSLLFIGASFSQQGKQEPKYLREANKAFDAKNYFDASTKCQDAFKKLGTKGSIKDKGNMAFKVAESYRFLEKYDKANEWYGVSLELKYFNEKPEIYFYKGEMQRMLKDFDGATKSYQEFKKIAPNQKTAEVETALKACSDYKDFDKDEPKVVVKCETKINTKNFDMAPAFFDKKGKMIYFGSSREESFGNGRDPITGEKYMDIFVVEFDETGNPTNKGVRPIDTEGIINTNQNEGTVCFDSKKKTMFFTRCPNAEKSNLGCDIWKADVNGESFENVIKMKLKSDSTISVGHPCLTEDGLMLIFASDMQESGGTKSFGGMDLWSINFNKKTKVWDSIPVNMGADFNTSGNELFPSIGPKGQLYFASNGWPGIGGMDIFESERVAPTENKWKKAVNKGYPFNSPGNDYAMCDFDGKSGFFTSERKAGSTVEYAPDIWSFSTPPDLYDLRVVVYEVGKKNSRIKDAQVDVTCTTCKDMKWGGKTNDKGQTEKWADKGKGVRYITVDNEYQISASKGGYLENKKGAKISTKGLNQSQSFIIEIPLIPEGEIRTPEVRYPLDQWTFINDATCKSNDSLKFLADLLIENPNITIDLFSHTDARDTDTHNKALSENRARAVYRYLVKEKGIDPRRIRPEGKGESLPAKWIDEKGKEVVLTEDYINQFKATDKAKFEKLHQINRRTTAVITDTNFDPTTSTIVANPKYLEFITPLPK
jgi:peptidoglycan-associated lipoprotein